jgi:Kef-type K+ transport system membrane component KefB
MGDVSFTNLLVVCAIAVVAPLLLGFIPRLRVPSAVLEIVAGILVGPAVLGWVDVDAALEVLSLIGLAFLLFLAGLEIDLRRLRGRLLRLALLGYAATTALGLMVGAIFAGVGWVGSPVLIAVMLSATSLGLVVAVLKGAGRVEGTVGQTIIAAATVADFAAIVLLTLFFSMSEGSIGGKIFLLAIFAGLVFLLALVLTRSGRSMALGTVLERLQDTTAQIRVRLAVVLLVALVAIAEHLGLENILGAFLAGAVVGLLDRDASSHPQFRVKLEAIGYGFLIPVFFVTSGVRLDLKGLMDEPSALLRVPVFLLALLVVRGVPALLYVPALGRSGAVAAALLQATSLPFIVTAAALGVAVGELSSVNAAALVCAGLLSVVIFPAAALSRLRLDIEEQPAPPTAD